MASLNCAPRELAALNHTTIRPANMTARYFKENRKKGKQKKLERLIHEVFFLKSTRCMEKTN